MAFKISNSTIIDDNRNIVNALAVGIGSTNPSTKLWVTGDSYVTGVVTASQLVSSVAQGTAPISVASSTKVTNLNVDYLNGQPGSYYQIADNLTGTAPGSVITQSNGLTISGNLNVSGNVSVSGTSFLLYAGQLQVKDRDIVLGLTTDVNNNDVSNDTTATHGGISIASTVGSPILNFPVEAGINSLPSTYKQLMWIKQGAYSGMGTDAWVSNYALSIGNTSTVQNGSRLTVGTGFTVFDTYLDATDIRARYINVSGVTTSGGVNVTTGNDYKINGTSVLTSTTLGSGVVNSSLTSVGTLGQLNVTGVSTLGNIYSTGIHTAASYYVGATTVLTTINSQVSITGIQTIDATTKTTLERELAFAPNDFNSLNVSGISTLQTTTFIGSGTSTGTVGQVLQVSGISSGAYIGGNLGIGSTNPGSKLSVIGDVYVSGVVTATSFYGSGANLTNIPAGSIAGAVSYASVAGVATSVIGGIGSITQLQVTGISTFTNGPVFIGAATSTGTASQPLQVTGGAYVSTNLAIGTTSPTQPLDVNGNLRLRAGLYDFNNVVGAAGSILVSTGAGVSWTSITGAGANAGINVSQDDTGIRYPLFASGANSATTTQYIDANGIVYNTQTNSLGIGTTSPLGSLQVGAGASAFVVVGSATSVSIGIGTTNPTQNLDVNGTLRLRAGLYDFYNVVGAAGSILVSTGAGVSWTSITGAGGASINISNAPGTSTPSYLLFTPSTSGSVTTEYVSSNKLTYIDSSGNLGIGSTTPTSKLDIIGDIKITGIITANDFNSQSDRKLKSNIATIINPIEKIVQINGVRFNWKDGGKPAMGVIAQEVEKVLPELVSNTDPKTVNYNGLIGLLIECVKEQQKQIDELKGKL